MPAADPHPEVLAHERWQAMQAAVARAQQQPMAVFEAVGTAATRHEAAAALMQLLDIDRRLAEDVLDLPVSEFLGRLRA